MQPAACLERERSIAVVLDLVLPAITLRQYVGTEEKHRSEEARLHMIQCTALLLHSVEAEEYEWRNQRAPGRAAKRELVTPTPTSKDAILCSLE